MTINEKLKDLAQRINEHKLRFIAALGLTGLVALTSLKDNVHFGAVRLHNPQGNHYAWGVWPTIEIEGKDNIKGNFYSIGLLVGANEAGNNSKITGDMTAYGLVGGINEAGNNSKITGDMKAYSLVVGVNGAGNNSTITGDMKVYCLIGGGNKAEPNSKITGDIVTFKLSIEPGAKFTGNCKMSESENNEGATFAKTKEPEKTSERLGK
jgi:cytoskeletal protein CcmA (bactofilin family)